MNGTSRRAWVKNVAIIFLIVLLLLTFFSNTILNYSLPEVSVQYASYDSITNAIKVSGTVKANESYVVTYDEADKDSNTTEVGQTRKIVSVYVKQGTVVAIGDPIIALKGGATKELEEAAWVDGAGPIRTYLFIIIPSSGVVFLTAGLFSVIWHWNDTYMPTMFLTERYPLSVAVSMITTQMTQAGMSGEGGLASGVTMAGCLMFIAPMLLLYLILQKWFIKSIDRVGIVG